MPKTTASNEPKRNHSVHSTIPMEMKHIHVPLCTIPTVYFSRMHVSVNTQIGS